MVGAKKIPTILFPVKRVKPVQYQHHFRGYIGTADTATAIRCHAGEFLNSRLSPTPAQALEYSGASVFGDR